MGQVAGTNQLHDVLEPGARLAPTSSSVAVGTASAAAAAAGDAGRPASVPPAAGPVLVGVQGVAGGVLPGQQLAHRLPLQNLEGEAGQGLREAVLPGAAHVHALVLAEDPAEQQALLGGHDPVVQLHLGGQVKGWVAGREGVVSGG